MLATPKNARLAGSESIQHLTFAQRTRSIWETSKFQGPFLFLQLQFCKASLNCASKRSLILVVQVQFFFFYYNTKPPSLFVWCTVEHRITGPEQEETWAMFNSWLGSLSKSILESSSDLKLSLILHQGLNMETIPLWCTPWKSLPVAQVWVGVSRHEHLYVVAGHTGPALKQCPSLSLHTLIKPRQPLSFQWTWMQAKNT